MSKQQLKGWMATNDHICCICAGNCCASSSVKISDIREMNPLVFSALEEVNLVFHLDDELNRDG